MSESALQEPHATPPEPAGSVHAERAAGRGFVRRHPWWWVTLAVIAVSIALVFWARTRPGFDPYGWLTWGQETINGGLDTNAAPSWKPLPYVFTLIFALAGHAEMRLWMILATVVSLAGSVFAGRIAYKLTAAPPHRRWAGWAAAVVAGLALLGLRDELGYSYFHYILSSQSDPMIVTLVLAAIDCHLDRRPRAAFVLGVLAGLGRPEVWAFTGLYTLWAWVYRPRMRWLLVAGWVATVLLWFGIPAITSRTPFVAASNAMYSGRAPQGNRITAVISRFVGLSHWPVDVAALLAAVMAAVRRDRTTLTLAGGVVLWVIIEIAFTLHGWPGLGRYMFEAEGVVIVLAGVFVGWLLVAPWPRLSSVGVGTAASLGGAAIVAALVVALIPPAISAARAEHHDITHQRRRTAEINNLPVVIGRLGGAARIRACGEALTRLEYQSMMAYTIGENVNRIGFKYGKAEAYGNPIILFTPYPNKTGWVVQAMHQVKPQCRSLPTGP